MCDMAKCRQKLLWPVLLFLCHYASSTSTEQEELVESEAKDGKLEIIKTIKKVNNDGSYTIGYEADDGSFKIESRDVLGNIKGTYGYVDEEGEIKRVSYSTQNTSELLTEPPTVVQRIPKVNRTYGSLGSRKPGILLYNPTVLPVHSTTSVIQMIPRRKTLQNTTTTTTTEKADEYITKLPTEATRYSTPKSNIVYASTFPRRPILRSTVTPQSQSQKSEGQLVRPELIIRRPTDPPRRAKTSTLDHDASTIKPVTEEPEVRSNLLRRQLSQEKSITFDPRQHVINLQQSSGPDSPDVYSASVSTGTPRPLFTTTSRPRLVQNSIAPIRPARYYPKTYHRIVKDEQSASSEYAQESTTESIVAAEANTQSPAPGYQIPANNEHPPEFVAVRHPFHRGVVFVPLNEFQAHQNNGAAQPEQQQYVLANGQYVRSAQASPTQQPENHQNSAPIFIQRPPILRSIPVQVDENGYVRPQPQVGAPTPYPIALPVTPRQYEAVQNEVDQIKPPVTTRDFQKLLEQLIIRQSRLEHINALIHAHQQRALQARLRALAQPTHMPIYISRPQGIQQSGPVTFIPSEQQLQRTRPFGTAPPVQTAQSQEQQAYIVSPGGRQASQNIYVQDNPVTYKTPSQYTSTRRVPRLLQQTASFGEQDFGNDYLPPQIREMLLLRMLQLAINPALPLDPPVPQFQDVEEQAPEASTFRRKKEGVRNVEVLGEETEKRRPNRSRRYRDTEFQYY